MISKNILIKSALAAAIAAISLTASATHSWGGYHWARTSNPFTIKVGNNLTASDWRASLAQTSSDWNSGNSPLNTALVTGTSNKRCSMVVGTIQVCNGTYGRNGWLGLASINISGGEHITQGSAKMNDTYFNTATYNNPNEKLHVVCQEVAHAFGLDHQSTDGSSQDSCMDYFSNTGANATSTLSTKPNAHDFAQLSTIYTHLDSSTTIAAMTALAARTSAVSNDPSSWGVLVRQSANGRSSTYERIEANNSKTVSHVYWTNEAAANCPSCDHRYDRHD